MNKKYSIEHAKNIRKSGRKSKLSMENKLLATLEYLREYRTYAHIAANYGVHESQIVRCVRWVEVTFTKDWTFRLPGKKDPLKQNTNYEVVLIDATEMPVERPKRCKSSITRAIKNAIQ